MRKPVVACLLTVLLGSMFGAPPALSKRKAIKVGDNYFVHAGAARSVTVERSDTVVWEWEGSNPHNVTVTRGPARFHSRTESSGALQEDADRSWHVQDPLHRAPAADAHDVEGRVGREAGVGLGAAAGVGLGRPLDTTRPLLRVAVMGFLRDGDEAANPAPADCGSRGVSSPEMGVLS